MKRRPLATLLLLLLAPLARADAFDARLAVYANLAPHKAVAVAVDDPRVVGIAADESSDTAASRTALQRCHEAQGAAQSACEVVRLNDTSITTAAAIRARVPVAAHPLFLWRFEAGAARVYLAGSIHVMKPSLYPLPPQYDAAFARADRLAVEVNTAALEPAAIQASMRTYALLPAGQSLGSLLRPGTLAAADAHLAGQSMTLVDVGAFKPAIVATQLAVQRMAAFGYLPEFGVEQHFIGAAGARPILELETLDEQLAVLTNAELAVQDEMLLETLQQMELIEPMIASMVTAWLAGDDAELRRLFDEQSGTSAQIQAFMRRLLEERNVGMAEKIATYLTEPGTTFVLVGAAHLTGDEGIVALLAARGIRGLRIQSNDTL